MFGQQATRSGDAHASRFEKHRQHERQLEESISTIKKTEQVIAYADWENKTADTIARRRHTQRVSELKEEQKESVLDRRRRLADLYNRESEQWEKEVLSNVETIDERKERIRARAIALRDVREKERAQFVQQCYDRQWRDACDDARTLDTNANLMYVANQRKEQLMEKEKRLKEQAKEDDIYMEKIFERIRFLEQREIDAIKLREEQNKAMRADLDAQVTLNFERQIRARLLQQEDDKKELEELHKIVSADELRRHQLKEKAHEEGRNVLQFNEGRLRLRKEQAERERQQDLMLIKYALAKDAMGEAEEKAKKDREREAMGAYNEYLQEQMVKEMSDQSEYDKIRLEAENRIWEERDRQQRAQTEARANLMASVHAGRQQQLLEKRRKEEEDKRYFDEQSSFDRISFEKQDAAEREAARKRKQALLEEAEELKHQMQERKDAISKERQEEYLQLKQMELFERQHKEKLAQQAGHVRAYHPRNHTQWYT